MKTSFLFSCALIFISLQVQADAKIKCANREYQDHRKMRVEVSATELTYSWKDTLPRIRTNAVASFRLRDLGMPETEGVELTVEDFERLLAHGMPDKSVLLVRTTTWSGGSFCTAFEMTKNKKLTATRFEFYNDQRVSTPWTLEDCKIVKE